MFCNFDSDAITDKEESQAPSYTTMASVPQWERLPSELWRQVLFSLDVRSLGAIASVCRGLSR
jgi:hypothetical protein